MDADDFVVKPFSPRELASRLHAHLRRAPSRTDAGRRRFMFDGLVIDETQREVAQVPTTTMSCV